MREGSYSVASIEEFCDYDLTRKENLSSRKRNPMHITVEWEVDWDIQSHDEFVDFFWAQLWSFESDEARIKAGLPGSNRYADIVMTWRGSIRCRPRIRMLQRIPDGMGWDGHLTIWLVWWMHLCVGHAWILVACCFCLPTCFPTAKGFCNETDLWRCSGTELTELNELKMDWWRFPTLPSWPWQSWWMMICKTFQQNQAWGRGPVNPRDTAPGPLLRPTLPSILPLFPCAPLLGWSQVMFFDQDRYSWYGLDIVHASRYEVPIVNPQGSKSLPMRLRSRTLNVRAEACSIHYTYTPIHTYTYLHNNVAESWTRQPSSHQAIKGSNTSWNQQGPIGSSVILRKSTVAILHRWRYRGVPTSSLGLKETR